MAAETITITKENPTILDGELVEDIPTLEVEKPSTALTIGNKEINLAAMSEDDKKKYGALTRNIKLSDINSISNYGSDLQNTMSRYSTTFLQSVRTTQTGEMGTLINGLLTQLNYVNVDDLTEQNALVRFMRKIPIIRSIFTTVEKTLRKYDTIEKSVDQIAAKIQATRLVSLRDNKALEIMFENNKQYCKQIEDLIIAGKIKEQEVKAKIDDMMAHASDYEPYEIQDVQEFGNNLERRLHDMMTLHTVVKQSLVQIRMVQRNNITLADKANSIVSTTIPVWKNQLSIAVAMYNQKEGVEVHRQVTDATNEILKKNAEMLHMNSVAVARENERSVIDIETLRKSTQELIDTIKDVQNIHNEGAMKRREAEAMIASLGSELETNMLQASDTLKLLN